MRKLFTILLTCALSLPILSQVVTTMPEVLPTTAYTEMLEIQPELTVWYQKDVVYKRIDSIDLHLQILRPRTDQTLPCVIYVQGSAWMRQDLYSNLPAMASFAQRGYVVAIVEYRHTGIAPFPAQVIDAKTAVRYMRKFARRYHIDPDKISIWGDSSGGHTVLMVGFTDDDQYADDVYADQSCHVNATVAFYPPTDISTMKDHPSTQNHDEALSPEGRLIGGQISTHMEAARQASPMYYIDPSHPDAPVMIVTGTMDELVPFSQSDELVDRLRKAGHPVTFYPIRGAGHASWHFWTTPVFDRVDQFLTQANSK